MKFAQYLQDTQTPEWKKAYIDYRGLKKRITVIKKSQQGLNFHVLPSDESPDETPSPPAAPRASDVESEDYERSIRSQRTAPESRTKGHKVASDTANEGEDTNFGDEQPISPLSVNTFGTGTGTKSTSAKHRPSVNVGSIKDTGGRGGKSFSSRFNGNNSRHLNPLSVLPLHELLNHLSPQEVSFFILLDAQLDKVESFYLAREKEMLTRGHMLKIQLQELQDHRKLFHEAQSQIPWASNIINTAKSIISLRHPTTKATPPQTEPPVLPRKPKAKFRFRKKAPNAKKSQPISDETNKAHANNERGLETGSSRASGSTLAKIRHVKSVGKRKEREAGCQDDDLAREVHEESEKSTSTKEDNDNESNNPNMDEDEHDEPGPRQVPLSADPDSYLYAKRKLKKAVLEHYRGLEVLHNYRVLNITGFRKALKKFEKVTKIPVQQQYMTEKVEKSAFASDKAVAQMMSEMEEMYAAAFVRGNKKMATKRLRAGNSSKSHHFSTFRSGAYIGIALPALIEGLVKVSHQRTREVIPAWDALLYVYGIILIPVLFTFLVGINLLVWANSRINYVFIFELDVLTQLDFRQYFEIPSILLASLCYAFWLSFSLIGHPHVSPTIWPLVWLATTFVIVFDPTVLPYRSSRYWLIKNVAKLFVSGTRRVEFTDFWMGDQFCSLIFTLSNFYFLACVYVDDFRLDWKKCSVSSSTWPVYFILAALPLFIRLVQSIKRYWDSKLITHLINGGKYGSGIVAYFFLYLWRRHQNERGTIFAFWCLTNIIYSVYASTWDFLMDWSVLRIHSAHPLLRPELIYSNHMPMYYFAIISNVLIRFIWIIYIPKSGPSMLVRTFVAGVLEMLRRWQWNFYRLENEHLGNVDQYRVTREVPLPYAFNDRSREDDADDDDHLKVKR